MAYQVLARKYRPQRFSDVAGQDHVTRTLLNALSQNRIAHGYIFSGHRGIGKTTIARILAQALNCRRDIGSPERPTPEPCGTCESCTEIRQGNAVDVIEIDAATNRGIDEIRELRDAARYRPARDRYKIYILDEAHQITDAAFNALLKTLEEPPDHIVFMMATTQPEDIPQTIRSRCQHFSFHAVRFDEILGQLRTVASQEDVAVEDAALALLAEAGDGSMRDALSIMDQAIASAPMVDGRPQLDAAQIRELMGSVPNTIFESFLEAIAEGRTASLIEELNRLLNAGNSPAQICRQFVRYLRNTLMACIDGEHSELLQISSDERARAARSALLFSEEDLTRFLQVALRTFDELNYRQEQRFHLELGLIKLVHLTRLLPVEEFLSKLPPAGSVTGTASGTSSAPRTTAPAPASRPSAPIPPRASETRPTPPAARAPEPRTIAPKPEEPARPAFSPFEADRSRKMSDDGPSIGASTQPVVESRAPQPEPAAKIVPPVNPFAAPEPARPSITSSVAVAELEPAPAPVALVEPIPAEPILAETVEAPIAVSQPVIENRFESRAEPSAIRAVAEVAPVAVLSEPVISEITELESERAPVGKAEPEQPLTNGALALAPEPSSSVDLDLVRDTICSALDAQGHSTASVLLSSGHWREKGDTIEVEVGIKKTMLGLTMNAEAEKICKAALRAIGVNHKLAFVPGEAKAPGSNPRPAASSSAAKGSIQAIALEDPLVKRAQELFKAEVRSVLDLRDSR
ncbi:DNA polymerase III subunit gamma/tau [Silvibacterium sp.]|uniref:DNA polymerase III subunit gamma/tau n=1 Tax=Silvibacterium sp. TaxID=1964179 RepID=UPI0039E3A181